MTLRRNQSTPRSCASLLTAVGLLRVSIGPPISVIERGAWRSPSVSISAVAASTGTDGWHTATTWVSPPRKCSMLMIVDVSVEIEAPVRYRHHASVNPVGDVDVVVGQEGF